jgi:hypothetical protein
MMLAQRFPIERVASAIVTVWGVCLICTVVCVNYQGLYAQRFFLGFLESGISPMFMVIVGSFYKKNEQALRMGQVGVIKSQIMRTNFKTQDLVLLHRLCVNRVAANQLRLRNNQPNRLILEVHVLLRRLSDLRLGTRIILPPPT